MTDPVFDLETFPVHLGLGASAFTLDRFDGSPEWYERYGASVVSDGDEGRLVSLHTFSTSWDAWEMHPRGDELVVCAVGSMVLRQEIDGEVRTVRLEAGQAVINPPGVWHTADVDAACTAWFITAGVGTEIRAR